MRYFATEKPRTTPAARGHRADSTPTMSTARNPSDRNATAPKGLTFEVAPGGAMSGKTRVPGDKSLSHRSILFGGIAHGDTNITGFLEGEDSLHTLEAFRAMGVEIERGSPGEVLVHGRGPSALSAPREALYLGNSGTGMRLMTGLLAGLGIPAVLEGDASLNGRPMRRIVEPLTRMGGRIDTAADGRPPLMVHAGNPLTGIEYICPIASAQVKSCVLLAGLHASGTTIVHEPAITRDHTERLLHGFGVHVGVDGLSCSIVGGQRLEGTRVVVPGDVSSAAFLMVGACMSPASAGGLVIQDVGLNPSRTGVIEILKRMGAHIALRNERIEGGEPVGDIVVAGSELRGIEIPEELVSLAIDEFPALFVAALGASGETVISGAAELRVKESDRIAVMADGLRALGADIEDRPDGARIRGGRLIGGTADSRGDHRPAMAFSIAALISDGPVTVLDCDNVNTSFPGFAALMTRTGLDVREQRVDD